MFRMLREQIGLKSSACKKGGDCILGELMCNFKHKFNKAEVVELLHSQATERYSILSQLYNTRATNAELFRRYNQNGLILISSPKMQAALENHLRGCIQPIFGGPGDYVESFISRILGEQDINKLNGILCDDTKLLHKVSDLYLADRKQL